MPPPMTSIRFGMPSSSSAPVESMTRGSSCGMKGNVTGSEPAAMMHWSKVTVFTPSLPLTSIAFGPVKRADALDDRDLAPLGEAGEAAGELLDHALLPAAQAIDVDLRLGELHAEVAHLLGLGDDLGGVQQRLRRDAADVEADAAERRVLLDQHHLLAEVGRPEGGGVAAGAGAEHHDLAVHVPARDRGLRCRGRGGRSRRGRRTLGFQRQDHGPLGDLVAFLDRDRCDLAGGGRWNLHRRLVGLELDQRVVLPDDVARLHEDSDHRHVLEIPDVGDLHLDGHASPLRAAGCADR